MESGGRGFCGCAPSRRAPKAEMHRARFLLGLAQTSLGNCAEAASTFERLWREEPLLRPYYAYQAAGCHLRRGDHKRALAPGRPGGPRLHPRGGDRPHPARGVERDSTLARGRAGRGNATPRSFRPAPAAVRPPSPPRSPSRRRVAGPRRPRSSGGSGPESRSETWSQRALARLDKAGQTARGKRAQDWLARGMVLFDRHQNEASEEAFASALQDSERGLDPAVECLAQVPPSPVGVEAAQPHSRGPAVCGGRAGLPARGRPGHARALPLPERTLPRHDGEPGGGPGGVRASGGGLPGASAGRRRPAARRRIGLGSRRRQDRGR